MSPENSGHLLRPAPSLPYDFILILRLEVSPHSEMTKPYMTSILAWTLRDSSAGTLQIRRLPFASELRPSGESFVACHDQEYLCLVL